MTKVKFTAFSTDASTGNRSHGSGEATIPDHVEPAKAAEFVAQRLAAQGHKDAAVTITTIED
ncbi:hypothetical protein ACFV2D_13560 [Streptomyces capillispiralis]|uniref:hypothetical protein n=1 Tax=Streptomyces capillispiralis TaxID=68182 RepID=UPI003690B051